jgi:hypothetical protein
MIMFPYLMSIYTHSDAYGGMSKMILYVAHVFPLIQEERSAEMSQAVGGKMAHAGTSPGRMPSTTEPIARAFRFTEIIGKNKI